MPTANPCGDCDLCCRLLAIEELQKAAGPTCVHHRGECAIYENRPGSCRGFRCLWLKSQRLVPPARLGPEWRPDRANLLMYDERDGMRLNVVVDPVYPDAWKLEPFYGYLKRASARSSEGHELVVYIDDRRTLIFPDDDIDLGQVHSDDRLVIAYRESDGRLVRHVELVGATSASAR